MGRMGRSALFVLLAAANCALLYYASLSAEHRGVGIVLVLAPVLTFTLAAAWKSRFRYPMLALTITATVALWLFLRALILNHYLWFNLLEHAGINTGLAFLFGRTLLGGRTALVTHFASLMHEELTAKQVRYTRQVTLAWTLFFSMTTLLSIVLFLFAPVAIWSLFANILYLPLLLVMFVVEYLVRLYALPDIQHVSFSETIRISSRYFRNRTD